MLSLKNLLTVVSILIVTSCAVRPITVALPLPPSPLLPALTDGELTCVSAVTYARIVRRDRAHRHYAERLEAVIKSTWR